MKTQSLFLLPIWVACPAWKVFELWPWAGWIPWAAPWLLGGLCAGTWSHASGLAVGPPVCKMARLLPKAQLRVLSSVSVPLPSDGLSLSSLFLRGSNVRMFSWKVGKHIQSGLFSLPAACVLSPPAPGIIPTPPPSARPGPAHLLILSLGSVPAIRRKLCQGPDLSLVCP